MNVVAVFGLNSLASVMGHLHRQPIVTSRFELMMLSVLVDGMRLATIEFTAGYQK